MSSQVAVVVLVGGGATVGVENRPDAGLCCFLPSCCQNFYHRPSLPCPYHPHYYSTYFLWQHHCHRHYLSVRTKNIHRQEQAPGAFVLSPLTQQAES